MIREVRGKKQINIKLDERHEELLGELCWKYCVTRTQLITMLILDKGDELKYGAFRGSRLPIPKKEKKA